MIGSGASFMAYLHHLDAGRGEEAARFIERSIANLGRAPLLISTAYFVEATYYYVRRGASPTLAREILVHIGIGTGDDISRLRADAAVLLAEGQTYLAAQTAQRAIKLADDSPDTGIAMAERDLARQLLTIAESSEPLLTVSRSRSEHEGRIATAPIA